MIGAKIVFFLLWAIVIIGTLLPLFHKKHWIYRAFEFPRVQKLALGIMALCIGSWLVTYEFYYYCFLLPLVVALLYISYLIFPFTPLASKTLASARGQRGKHIKLLVANVYQYNQDYHKLGQMIRKRKPDLCLFVETDRKWTEELSSVTNEYPFKVEVPLDNTYGMLFYSRFEIRDAEVRYLVDQEYPSIRAYLKIAEDWPDVLFYGIHPPPPSPTENTYSTERDREILMVAREIENYKEPVIVAGDLNDVAWSYTTERFVTISGTKDPRKGRGIFSTYNANNIFFRWPLDHIFCSDHFRLLKMGRPGKIGSDHFPVALELVYVEPSAHEHQGRTSQGTQ